MGVTLEELAREVERLKQQLERVAEQSRERQDDWGTVRTQSGKVVELLEQLRALSREVERLKGQRPTEVVSTPTAVRPAFDLKEVASVVLTEVRRGGALPTANDVREVVQRELQTALGQLDLRAVAEQVLKEVTVGGVEERLARLLKDSLAKDLDPKAIAALIVERAAQQIKVEELREKIIAQIAEKLASQIELTTKRRY